jgi:NAD(P)-dependent dehydrogenase (short-subunit alcohol dehydrogenase family)
MASRVPLGRVADADDMARVALWLFTDGASYINGAVIPVDGGQEA